MGECRAVKRVAKAATQWVLSAAMASVVLSSTASAQSLLSDAETEKFLRVSTKPILEAAGLTPQSMQYYIVAADSLNAFATIGQNVFVHTGLFTQTDNVGQVMGVLAHEIGHISGGHAVRRNEAAAAPTAVSLISMLLGAAAIAAGAGDAGVGIIAGGQRAAQGTYLAYSRAQEASADQAAARFLRTAHMSGQGLLETFRKFSTQEYLIGVPQDPYVRSHPLSGDRVAALERVVNTSPYAEKPFSPELQMSYERIKAKIQGFMDKPETTLSKFPLSDQSIPARYARAYAYHKSVQIDKALKEIDSLIAEKPDDPFFLELKGQLLLENGRVEQSLESLRHAVELAPKEPQIRTLLGRALIATEDKKYTEEAIKELEVSARQDPNSPFTWFQLGIAYSNKGDEGMASLATAERAALSGELPILMASAKRASELLDKDSPSWLRAQDLLVLAEAHREEYEEYQRRQRRRLSLQYAPQGRFN